MLSGDKKYKIKRKYSGKTLIISRYVYLNRNMNIARILGSFTTFRVKMFSKKML